MNIIMSIKPKWAQKIYNGEKTIEWRKTFPKEFISNETKVYLYETAPVCKVTGFFILDSIIKTTLESARTVGCPTRIEQGCVPLNELIKYKSDSKWLYGYVVTFPQKRDQRQLSDFGLKRPPQSWQYLKEGK